MEGERRATPYGPFPVDYLECPLIDLCAPEGGVQTGPFGSQLHKRDYVEVGTPIITVEHLGDNRILHDATPKVSDADRGRLSRYQLRPGDIVFSRVGSVDRRALVSEEEAGWLFSGRCLRVRPNPELIDPTYLSYFFGLETFKEYVRSIAVGATMPSINTAILSNVPVIFPQSIHEQQAIASILKALDDKIELNRRMSETLERIARELYRAWFVDFSAGPAAIREVAGELPAGWFYGTLADVSELSSESWRARSAPDAVEYLDLANVKWGRVLGTSKYAWGEAPSRARRILRYGDTIIGTVRPGNGSYALITQEGLTGSTGFAVLRPKVATARAITYLAATDMSNIERLAHLADGAAYPAVRPPVVHESPMTVPDQATLLEFSSAVDPLLDRIAVCEAENRTLEALRDTLLPKLISGELRVPEAEQLVSEVA